MIVSNSRSASDTAWKDVLDFYFKEFIELCLPDLYELINWQQAWSYLDKELHAITKDGILGHRLVDKLVRVYLKNGIEQWILIHIEVQGKQDKLFTKRMFTYACRIYDKYDKAVVSCAVLTDSNARWRPNSYEISFIYSRLSLEYHVVKLLDYRDQEADLEDSPNPFAQVILSCLAMLKLKKSSHRVKYNIKVALTKRLYRKGFTKEQVKKLFLFLDWLIQLPKEFELEYDKEIQQIEESHRMAYISSIERLGRERGFKEGHQQGMEEGIHQGMQQGMQQGERQLLFRQLERKFKVIPEKYRQQMLVADAETLLVWGEKILSAKTLNDIFF